MTPFGSQNTDSDSTGASDSRTVPASVFGERIADRPIESPCNQVCQLDADQICIGCGRTRSEIGCWSSVSDETKIQICREAKSRLDRRRPHRTGFTLIELLVVIAIVGILVGLLMPAVQAVREASRKTSCKNNLHQIGIALHAYHNVHASLPTGCIEWRSWRSPHTHRQFAWSAMLLPFLEQQALHDRIDWSKPYDHDLNRPAAETDVPTYLCPSEPTSQLTPGHTAFGGIFGERLIDRQPDDGLFLYEQKIRFRDILDGLTHTLAVAEDVGGPDKQWINGRNVFVVAHGVNDQRAWIGDNEIRSVHPSGAMVLFADGRTTFMTESITKPVLGKLITRDKREIVNFD